jgi:hypothetical protein
LVPPHAGVSNQEDGGDSNIYPEHFNPLRAKNANAPMLASADYLVRPIHREVIAGMGEVSGALWHA